MTSLLQELWREEDGLQTVELVLILVVTISLVAILRTQANNWMKTMTDYITSWIATST
jgi:Flp pilus assembly pilin Flp